MTLLDRFRTSSRDKHPDAAVRLAFVEELPIEDRTTIAAMAREDEDAKVRRAAVAKLMAPAVLAVIAREDKDEGVRAQAYAMLRDIALEAFEEVTEAESLEALEEIAEIGEASDRRVLGQIAKTATRELVAFRAASRIDDPRVLGSVARHAVVEAARQHALASLRERGDHAELLAVALNSDFKDTAVGALESLTDSRDLDQVIARGRNKSAVKRARAIVRETEEQAARESAEAASAATAALIAALPAVPESEVETASPPHGDPLAAAIESDSDRESREAAAQAERERADALAAEQAAEQARLSAEAEAAAQEAAAQEAERRHARLRELVEEAAAAAADEALPSARKRFGAVSREWTNLAAGIIVDADLLERFTTIHTGFSARDAEAREADAAARREALGRIHALLARVDALMARPDLTLKAADRALRDVRATLAAMPQLPSKLDFDEVSRRLKAAQAGLIPKLTELREADDWKRFANASVQEQLCARMEALKAAADPEAIAREVHELQQRWRETAEVPRAQADALWRRFKTAHDEVWVRCEAHFAAQAQERAENLAKKVALCEQAESRAESLDWIRTADEIKKLQAEWKTVGPVSRGKEKAVWDRFRAACDRFFTRRHDDLQQRKAAWNENLAKKDALCLRAEALADSTDWEAAAADVKRLQSEWKTIGPVKKSKSDAVWQRFRAACDRFFARYAARHDTARAERLAAREGICAELEAFAAAIEQPADLPSAIRALRGRWQQEVAARGVDPDRARLLDHRFSTAFAAVVARWPVAFAGSDLDPDANRKRMETLVRRVEDLAASLNSARPSDDAVSPTTRLAAMLKEALAANTIGGKADDAARFRAAGEELQQAQASWQRIGHVPEEARRELADRFQRAARTITTAAASSARPAAGRGNNPKGSSPAS